MKALVKYARGPGMMELMDVPVPEPEYGEVRVAVTDVGICGTDLKIYDDTFLYNPPVIVGHEFAGVIEKLGKGVQGWAEGDRVVSEQHTGACGHCDYCLTGNRHLCPEKRSPGYLRDGAYTDYICVPASLLHKIPDAISGPEGAILEPMAIAACGILGKTRIYPEELVVILGCGPISILALQMVKAQGAAWVAITGIDRDEKIRFPIAKKYGAQWVIKSMREDPVEFIRQKTGGLGADVVIDLSGAPAAIVQGFEMLRKNGRFCALGLPPGDVSLPWAKLILKAVTVSYSFSSDYQSWERCLSMIRRGAVRLDEFTKNVYPLEDWETAFDHVRRGMILKGIIRLKSDESS
jgi:L-iditol 2-dehydrogenase